MNPLLKCTLVLPMILASGCATLPAGKQVIRAGDHVRVSFTCRFPEGDLAATTHKSIADDTATKKPPLYLPLKEFAPVSLKAGFPPAGAPASWGFGEEIEACLAAAVPGMTLGEQKNIECASGLVEGRVGDERFFRMARVRKRPKEMRLSREEYKSRANRDPVVGTTIVIDPAIPGRIAEVTDKEVVVAFPFPEHGEVVTSLGKGRVRDAGDHYEIDIEAKVGDPIMTGPLAGRISEVSDSFVTIDYGYRFGGRDLRCDMVAEESAPDTGQAPIFELENELLPRADGHVTDVWGEAPNAKSGVVVMDLDEKARKVELQDIATLDYTLSLEDGSLVDTSIAEVARDKGRKKSKFFPATVVSAPVEVVAGFSVEVPGMTEAAPGMTVGGEKRVLIPPEKGFGIVDPAKKRSFPRVASLPLVMSMNAEEYVQKAGGFPTAGKETQVTPYFRGRVTEIGERDVKIALLVKDGERFQDNMGTVTAGVRNGKVTLTLEPRVGGDFADKSGNGKIVAVEGDTFTVDFNHPLAGRPMVLDLRVRSLVKASEFRSKAIGWLEDHDFALKRAKEAGKPTVLVLYADWCGFCKKLFGETVSDPRVRNLSDSFIWAKVNSDREKKYYDGYGQKGFPLVALLRPDGTVAGKIDGFRDGAAFSRLLKEFLAGVGKAAE